MKVHDKVKVKTNEEMFRELVMDLVDNVLEKTYEQTNINEDLSEERHGSKMNSWSFYIFSTKQDYKLQCLTSNYLNYYELL